MTPFDHAHEDWPEDLKRERLSELIQELPVPTGIEDFDRAWRALAADRPDVPAHRCPYRRTLVKKFYDRLDTDD